MKYYFQLSLQCPGWKPHKLQERLQYYLIEKNSNIRLLRKLIGSQVPAEFYHIYHLYNIISCIFHVSHLVI